MEMQNTQFGFEWGPVKIERGFSDEIKEWVVLIVTTKKHPRGIQVYVTKTGKVRVFGGTDGSAEWLPPQAKEE